MSIPVSSSIDPKNQPNPSDFTSSSLGLSKPDPISHSFPSPKKIPHTSDTSLGLSVSEPQDLIPKSHDSTQKKSEQKSIISESSHKDHMVVQSESMSVVQSEEKLVQESVHSELGVKVHVSGKLEESEHIWSKPEDISELKKSKTLPKDENPFYFDGRNIRYNVDAGRGLAYKNSIIFGAEKLHDGHNYLSFDPNLGTLTFGTDINLNNGDCKHSLVCGNGTSSNMDCSLVSGFFNEIVASDTSANDSSLQNLTACAIIGGSNNTIRAHDALDSSTSIIASSGIEVAKCSNTVVLGLKSHPEDEAISGLNEACVTRNMFALGSLHVGTPVTETPMNAMLSVAGDTMIGGNLKVQGSILQSSIFVRNTNDNEPLVIMPDSHVSIIYAYPEAGPITIYLGDSTDDIFPSNYSLMVKDTSLEFGETSSYDIHIKVPINGTSKIEQYVNGSLVAMSGNLGSNGHVVDTCGGSVTLRYFNRSTTRDLASVWVVENMFKGNPRIKASSGIKFIKASPKLKNKFFR